MAIEQELREPEGKNIFIECEEECHNGFRNLMYKVLQKFQVGSKCCVSLEGDAMLLKNGLNLKDEMGNIFSVESIGMVNYKNIKDCERYIEVFFKGDIDNMGQYLSLMGEV